MSNAKVQIIFSIEKRFDLLVLAEGATLNPGIRVTPLSDYPLLHYVYFRSVLITLVRNH